MPDGTVDISTSMRRTLIYYKKNDEIGNEMHRSPCREGANAAVGAIIKLRTSLCADGIGAVQGRGNHEYAAGYNIMTKHLPNMARTVDNISK